MPPRVRKDVILAPYTTLAIGGRAEYFAALSNDAELKELLAWANTEALPVTVIGGGSNVLIADSGIPGLVLHMDMRGVAYEEDGDRVTMRVGAGETWENVVRDATERGFWGIENLAGIPGRVGAAPVQNINAYGVSVGDSVLSVAACHKETMVEKIFERDACAFKYRDSIFKSSEGSAYIITSVSLSLSRTKKALTNYRSSSQSIARLLEERGIDSPTPGDVRDAVRTVRGNIGMLPSMFRSAGSFFKNTIMSREEFLQVEGIVLSRHPEKNARFAPWHWEQPDGTVKVSTAFLMECTPYNKTDFKDKTWNGTVGISPLHTLSVINVCNASASDVRTFVEAIIKKVFEEFSVRIEPEVCFLP